ncbi:MAG: hypothetical protein J7K65_00560, partial [Planctomycetes bacterium]|nr:hypothetical protein [Planctomycetota bacterium]
IPGCIYLVYYSLKLLTRSIKNKNLKLTIVDGRMNFYSKYYDSSFSEALKLYDIKSPQNINLSNATIEISDSSIFAKDKNEIIFIPSDILSLGDFDIIKNALSQYSSVTNKG